MKCFAKVIFLFVLGLFVSIFVYPLVHESGHSLAALISGIEIIEIKIFPQPYSLFFIGNVADSIKVFIGFSGILLPFIISILPALKCFITWFMKFVFRVICIFSYIFSIIILIFYKTGYVLYDDDIVKVMMILPESEPIIFIGLVLMLLLTLKIVIKSAPVNNISDFILKNNIFVEKK